MIELLRRLDAIEGLEKQAAYLARRQAELSGAPTTDFAVVIHDGMETRRKYPVKTAEDVLASRDALEAMAPQLPDEVVSCARYHLDLASREKRAEALYDGVEPRASNVIYTGHIDRRAYHSKLASRAPEKTAASVVGAWRVSDADDVREAAAQFARLSSEAHKAELAPELVKAASTYGVEVTGELARFNRERPPANFEAQVDYRARRAPDVLVPFYEELKKEASRAKGAPALIDLARCVETLDEFAGFIPLSGERGALRKLAHAPDAFSLVFPEREPASDPERDLSKVAAAFGDAFVERWRKDPRSAEADLGFAERAALSGLLGSS